MVSLATHFNSFFYALIFCLKVTYFSWPNFGLEICGQAYKQFRLIIYDSRVVMTSPLGRVVNYVRKVFIILTAAY